MGYSLELKTIDILAVGFVEHYEYGEYAGGSHLIVNGSTKESILLDDHAYNTK